MTATLWRTQRSKLLFIAIFALGISSIITQLTVMRELLAVANANELIIGILLGNWLLLTGLGAYLGKFARAGRRDFAILIGAEIIIAILPVIHIVLIRVLRNAVFLRGEAIGMAEITLSSLVLLLPYCLLSGFLLTFACTLFTSPDEKLRIGQVYFIDSLGDIFGGFVFSFFLVYFFDTFQILYIAGALNLLCAARLAWHIRSRVFAAVLAAALIALFAVCRADLNTVTTAVLFKGEDVIAWRDSIYGNLVVTRIHEQYHFYENGQLLFFTGNSKAKEETVHFAMAQHRNPKNILLISGGASGTAGEILKYGPERIDYVELDPLIIELGRKYTSNLDDPRIAISNLDGRRFVKNTGRKFDVVILDLPPPGTAQLNRFYTCEFLVELKSVLNPGGVVSLQLPASENYRSRVLRRSNSILFATMNQLFENILILPGEANYFIASDAKLETDIAAQLALCGIETMWVNRDRMLPAPIFQERIEALAAEIDPRAVANRDFNPALLFLTLKHWLSKFKFRLWLFAGLVAAGLLLYLLRLPSVPFALFTTGFSAAALEVVLLMSFQILYGYMYHQLGIIVTMFMLGLAVGSYYMNRSLKHRGIGSLVKLEFALAIFACMLGPVLFWLGRTDNALLLSLSAHLLFPGLTVLLAIIVGMEFPLSARLFFRGVADTAGVLYTADLVGAFAGAAVVGALLIPLLGIMQVCLLAAAFNLLSGTILYFAHKK
ncbi:fused MFS/spermidine synthase [Planctomycetota bacterium]